MACSRELFNVVMLGLGFLLIMGGYSPVQNFATSLLNLPCLAIGSFSIGLIYAALAIAALLVSRHDIAAIWVAFFSRCQRYRC